MRSNEAAFSGFQDLSSLINELGLSSLCYPPSLHELGFGGGKFPVRIAGKFIYG